ncbi:MAG: hypothetical protein HYU43_00435, partial [Armatimonadetes bacterium]|nr:hypothetical protein [Armatimonadota bacterium]
MNAASALPGPLHAAGLRSFPVLASYIRTMPSLHGMTGEADDAVRARRLADVKIGFLSTPLPGSNPGHIKRFLKPSAGKHYRVVTYPS